MGLDRHNNAAKDLEFRLDPLVPVALAWFDSS